MKRLLPIMPLLGMMGLIFFLSHQPGDRLDLPAFFMADKAAHAFAYFLLGGTVILALGGRRRGLPSPLATALVTVLFCLLFGILDEFHQSFIPRRSADGADVLADICGGALAAAVWTLYLRRRGAPRRRETLDLPPA
ncbi:MAG: VanZ family protein [Thermodesulfobacteriota bacterium]